jgi:hypothetical protein
MSVCHERREGGGTTKGNEECLGAQRNSPSPNTTGCGELKSKKDMIDVRETAMQLLQIVVFCLQQF